MRVLVVEDSAVLRDSLAQGLREAGFAVDAAGDGERGLLHARTTDYDVIVLDWMLPRMDGLAVLDAIRGRRIPAAVLMLTARDSVDDKVRGLSAGADDYLVKPFAFKELLARVKTLARRRHGERAPVITIGPLSVDTAARSARVADRNGGRVPLVLSPREYALLEVLALRRGHAVTRAEIEEHLYDDRSQVCSNAVDSAVAALRSKLDAAGCPALIHTRRKVGYVLRADPDAGAPP
jgi:DNA-binding response OmpR family regulator